MSSFNQEELNRLIADRRSIYPKMYTGEVVDDSIVKQMLENANWAPTHRFTEPWRFNVYKGDGIKILAELQAHLYKEKMTKNGAFDETKHEKLLKKPLLCSHIISVGMKRDPKESVPEIEEIAAVSMAVQNMYLTATAYGIGCYWGTGGITFYEEAKPFFGLGEEDKLMGFLFIGIPSEGLKMKGLRGSINDKTLWVNS
jgi:nitroreductase